MNIVQKILRKARYWASNYAGRLVTWVRLVGQWRAASAGDALTLYASFLLSPLTALLRLSFHKPPVLLGDVTVIEPHTGTFRLRAGTDDPFHIMRWREPRLFDLIDTTLQPGDRFVDAGSNIGYFSLLASRKVGAEGEVVAVEMMPDTADRLRRNIESSAARNINVIETALASEAGIEIEAHFDPTKFGQASLVGEGKLGRSQKIVVHTSRLDQLLGDRTVKLMKMDLEGAEYDALLGAAESLSRIENIVFESNDRDERIFAFLEENGFEVTHFDLDDFLARNRKLAEATG